MGPTFRASMTLLHSWAGVIVGSLLFAIFWMGTLSVFDREIDRWMMPATRSLPATTKADLDVLWKVQGPAHGSSEWSVTQPTERTPMARIRQRGSDGKVRESWHHPQTGQTLPEGETFGGSQFLYPFHYNLHLKAYDIGSWLVGFAGMTMLAMLVSGVVIHRKIFADFFTLKPGRQPRRLLLEFHTVAGVAALPFHVLITLSGLVIFFAIYFPATEKIVYGDTKPTFAAESQGLGDYARGRANRPATSQSLNKLYDDARRHWGDGPFFIRVRHPGDANAFVEMRRAFDSEVRLNRDALYFDAVTGRLLHVFTTQPVVTAQRFIAGLHSIRFRHWSLRWLYFALGLAGCTTIATGFMFWVESRRRRHEAERLAGARVVEALSVGSVTGIVVATLAFLVANRLLPSGVSLLGETRAALEVWCFYIAWLLAFSHAWSRQGRAWMEQCLAIAMLAAAAVTLNWATTGDHLARSLTDRSLWAIGGMDVTLLAGAAAAGAAALGLQRRRARRLQPV